MHFSTIAKAIEAELLPKIKGSRFIGFIAPVTSRQDALNVVSQRRAMYPQANHHCFAYSLAVANESYCSDDGEPHSTAGRPIQQVLSQHRVQDACLVVSRIFGGTKLGTGGLVRAYAGAAELVMSEATIVETQLSTSRTVQVPIRYAEMVKKSIVNFDGRVTSLDFGVDSAALTVQIPLVHSTAFHTYVNELTGGRAAFSSS
ncbi:hypothetical protein DYB37_007897 [Aphanomyces astaci]|uniref:Impact N-terminal domain-containing protein n=1 Tax=Aphanomyces astaci TaxID=112090 RepID=A0A397EXX9_APHAT|nr:hypothetical protein AaE_010988 [Aphanomyces astaci]RHY13055.1 hypothetical protein DYB36_013400 [Aphanomyces astaci]RHY49453.1 hypothetical protein DYB34_013039 [Aphanomyces astaci]RHY75343.1 hypothetical protein DYB38_013218 [Aphanomyces astaci]RHY76982.1 hypothetical protein DYB30_013842 [Aphanomyces astaci]